MHPEILREIISQRGHDMQAQAHRARLARMASRTLRAARRGRTDEADELVIPAIPDYVDGSFRTEQADELAASQPGRVPAARRA